VLFGRRRRGSDPGPDREEQAVIAVARDAVPRIRACFTTDPDQYEVRAAIIYEPTAEQRDSPPPLDVFELKWGEQYRSDYFESGDARYLLEEVVGAADEEAARAAAHKWVGSDAREVPFNLLPGLYQTAFVGLLAGREPPSWPLGWLWVVASDDEYWPVRYFPSGLGENAPPIGEVGYVLMPRVAIEEIWRLRGW
jgi:hypothetical protein